MMVSKIDRRSVLAAAAAGGTVLAGAAVNAGAQPRNDRASPEMYEFRTYHLVGRQMRERLDAYLADAFIPAARRAGCGPVGAFATAFGTGSANVHLLVPHPSMDAFLTLPDRLAADAGYARAAAGIFAATPENPPYVALDIKLMRAFAQFPRLETPNTKDRIFELRTYRSHDERAGRTKIGMFEGGGEIDIFRRVGLTPVFFAQDLTGTRLPSLTYMLTFPDLPTRERAWRAFGADPAWRKLIATPGLAETVTDIDNPILTPLRYSQI